MELKNQQQLREEALANYRFYIQNLTGQELQAEYDRCLQNAMLQNELAQAPDYDDNSDGDITIR